MNKVGGGGLMSKWNRPEEVWVDSQLIEINRMDHSGSNQAHRSASVQSYL